MNENRGTELASATVNGDNYTVTCGYEDCGYTEKLPAWAVAHGNEELTWICSKCSNTNLLMPWW